MCRPGFAASGAGQGGNCLYCVQSGPDAAGKLVVRCNTPAPCSLTACYRTALPSKYMAFTLAKETYILGLTRQGRVFRPSDWAERLAGVMSQFRPGGPQPGSHLGYSPWCVPTSIGETKCVIIHPDLREHDVMAWDFCLNFARDNDLQTSEGAPPELPQASATPRAG